jgi:hypothetical protein
MTVTLIDDQPSCLALELNWKRTSLPAHQTTSKSHSAQASAQISSRKAEYKVIIRIQQSDKRRRRHR